MNRAQYEAKAREVRNRIKETWNKLDNQELAFYRVSPTEFYQRLNEKYGISREAAKARISEFEVACNSRRVA